MGSIVDAVNRKFNIAGTEIADAIDKLPVSGKEAELIEYLNTRNQYNVTCNTYDDKVRVCVTINEDSLTTESALVTVILADPFYDETAQRVNVGVFGSWPYKGKCNKLWRMWSTDDDFNSELTLETAPNKNVYDLTTSNKHNYGYRWQKTNVNTTTPTLTYRFMTEYTDCL